MQPKRINASLSVSEQILPEALAGIAAAGFRSIICNRPDGEGADQPGFAEIEAAYQPVTSGQVQDSDAAAFGTLFASLPKPVFAYCAEPAHARPACGRSQRQPRADLCRRSSAAPRRRATT